MAKEYIHSLSIGDDDHCIKEKEEIDNIVRGYSRRDLVRGFQTIIIQNENDVSENLIYSDYVPITNGRFPYLFLAIEYIDVKKLSKLTNVVPEKDEESYDAAESNLEEILKTREYQRLLGSILRK